LRSSKAKKLWRELFLLKPGDHVKILQDLKTLPFYEKGSLGKVLKVHKIHDKVFLVKIENYYLWLPFDLLELTNEPLK